MKPTIQNDVLSRIRRCLLVFAVAGGMTLLISNAQGAGNTLPPEVRSLIGMKLPPIIVGKARASIPNFVSKTGGWAAISFEEGILGGKWPIFIVERIDADRSLEILDVQILPDNLIDWRFVDGEFSGIQDRFSLSENCRSSEEDERMIFGLVKPEKGKETCSHFSKRVKLAWKIDRESGKITPMPTQGLQCFYLTMDDCF